MDDLVNRCRLCLRETNPSPLVNCLNLRQVLDAVDEVFGFQIRENDVCSTRICKECIAKVTNIAMYRKSVLFNQDSIARYYELQTKILEIPPEIKQEDDDDVIYISTAPPPQIERVEVSSTQFPKKKYLVKLFARKSTTKLPFNVQKKTKLCIRTLKVVCSVLQEKDVKNIYLNRLDRKLLKLHGKKKSVQPKVSKNKQEKSRGKIVPPIRLKLSNISNEPKKSEASTSNISKELPEDEIPLKKIQEELVSSKISAPIGANIVFSTSLPPQRNYPAAISKRRKTFAAKVSPIQVQSESNLLNKSDSSSNRKAIISSTGKKLKEIMPVPNPTPITTPQASSTPKLITARNKNVKSSIPDIIPDIIPNLSTNNIPNGSIIVSIPNSLPMCPTTKLQSGSLLFLTGNNMPVFTNTLPNFQTVQNTMNCMPPMNVVTSTANTNLTITNPRSIYQANNINNSNTLIFEEYIPFDSLFQNQASIAPPAHPAPLVINDPKVKVLSVSELNMRVDTCTNDNINNTNLSVSIPRKLPIRITLVRVRNEMLIKLSDSRNQEMHYTQLSEAEKWAVRNSLLNEESRKQFEAAMRTCQPDRYSLELLTSLGLSQSSFNLPSAIANLQTNHTSGGSIYTRAQKCLENQI